MESSYRKKIKDFFQDFPGLEIVLLREKMDKEFVPTLEEKTQYSEVTTPYALIEEMLDSIPSSFWECPERKVFEPCCGKGGFVISLFERFFKGLQGVMEDEFTRAKHILNNILYFADISLSNIMITREMLRAYASFRCQSDDGGDFSKVVCCGFCENSLGFCDGVWVGLFDAVVGNPPFNAGPEHKIILWPEFVYRALEVWIKSGGYLLFLHPPGWRKPFTRRRKNYTHIFDLMTQHNQMLKLSINGKKEGWSKFNCGTRFDWYLISTFGKEAKLPNQTGGGLFVEINDEDGIISHIDLAQWKWLPSKNYGLISSILAKEDEERCPIMYSRSDYGTDKYWMSSLKNEDIGFVHPCIHSTLKGGVVRYYYSKVNNKGFFGEPKVIFGESGIFEPILDLDGTYGMTHCAMAIAISGEEEGNKIVAALKSDKFDELIQSCCFSSFRIDWRMFLDFKRDFYLEFL
jgi:hypothetical protein